MIEVLGALEPVRDELFPAEQARILRLLIERIDVAPDGLSVTLHAAGFAASSRNWRTRRRPLLPRPNPCWRPQIVTERAGLEVDTLTIRIPMRLQRRGGRKLIMAPEDASAPVPRKLARDETFARAA